MKTKRPFLWRRRDAALCAIIACGALACSEPEEEPSELEPEQANCAFDEQSEATQAVAFAAQEEVTGLICPVEDEDWWRYEMPADHDILQVDLQLTSQISPIEVTYGVWPDTGGMLGEAIAGPRAQDVGGALSDVRCVEPGPLLIKVSDAGNNAQDTRHNYRLSVNSRPDPDAQEPNDSRDDARALNSGASVTGAIACTGDEDWFAIDVPTNNLVRVTLTSAVATYEPTLQIRNDAGDTLVDESNPSGSVMATAIDRFEVLEGAGRYYIRVADNDGEDADPSVTYQLGVEFVPDADPNEPNNHPDEATPLTGNALDCANGSLSMQGTIGSANDQDWYRIPLGANCDGAILDVEATLDTSSLDAQGQWDLQRDLQLTTTLVRPHAPSACSEDSACNTLALPCNNDNDCAGFFNTCLPEGLCQGSSVCLPEDVCGANQVLRRYDCPRGALECQPEGASTPPANRAFFSAPLFGDDYVYVKVNDFQADEGAPDLTYTLSVEARQETDSAEPSNLYFDRLPQSRSLPPGPHKAFVRDIPVHDCTMEDCCDGSTWETGTISYENDLDWFRYAHPCPGEDCMMRMHYEMDGGEVDFVVNLYRESNLWFTTFENENEMSGAQSGTYGGLAPAEACFYAYQNHTRNNGDFNYYVVVRDILRLYERDELTNAYKNRDIPKQSSRDWSGQQRYRICFEKVADACEAPCQLYDNGCGQPEN